MTGITQAGKIFTTLASRTWAAINPKYYATTLDEFLASMAEGEQLTLIVGDRSMNNPLSFGPTDHDSFVYVRSQKTGPLPYREVIMRDANSIRPMALWPPQEEVDAERAHFEQQARLCLARTQSQIAEKRPDLRVIPIPF